MITVAVCVAVLVNVLTCMTGLVIVVTSPSIVVRIVEKNTIVVGTRLMLVSVSLCVDVLTVTTEGVMVVSSPRMLVVTVVGRVTSTIEMTTLVTVLSIVVGTRLRCVLVRVSVTSLVRVSMVVVSSAFCHGPLCSVRCLTCGCVCVGYSILDCGRHQTDMCARQSFCYFAGACLGNSYLLATLCYGALSRVCRLTCLCVRIGHGVRLILGMGRS